jgi:hypothetical protein
MQEKRDRECVPVTLTRQELSAIDYYRFERRIPSRAQAVRALLRRGLTVEGVELRSTDERSR